MLTGPLLKLFRFLALPVVAGLAVGLSVLWWYEHGPGARDAGAPATATAPRADSYSDAVARAAPAVVNVYTTQIVTRGGEQLSDNPLFNRFMERPPGLRGAGVLRRLCADQLPCDPRRR